MATSDWDRWAVTESHPDEEAARLRAEVTRARNTMAALGRVAGDVAHEINNLLQPLITLTELELEADPADDAGRRQERRESLEMVIACGRQMRAIVHGILVVARRDKLPLAPVDFPAALRRAIMLASETLPPGVRIGETLTCAPGLLATINEVALIEVMTDLLARAAHAMRGNGGVSVLLQRIELAAPAALALGLAGGGYFELSVRDTGDGMDAETMARIFDPFVTTRPVGEGIALGLSAAQGVLRDWQGAITVDSAVGRGTTFTLRVPITEPAS